MNDRSGAVDVTNSRGGDETPLVSIIIPAHNVAPFVEETIDSALGQSYPAIEIVIVENGSNDETPRIVDNAADGNPRIIVDHQPAIGPGAARNRGVEIATGDLLMFLDADDLLEPDAVSALADLLVQGDASFAAGRVDRFVRTEGVPSNEETWRSSLTQSAFDVTRRRTSLAEFPDLVWDTSMCAKLIRRSFWVQNDFSFPVDQFFEDMAVATAMYSQAEGVATSAPTAYRWRLRTSGRPSTTQSNHELSKSRDRLLALHQCWDSLALAGWAGTVGTAFSGKIQRGDLVLLCRAAAKSEASFAALIAIEGSRIMARIRRDSSASDLTSRPVVLDSSDDSRHLVAEDPIGIGLDGRRHLMSAIERGDADSVGAWSRVLFGRPRAADVVAVLGLRAVPDNASTTMEVAGPVRSAVAATLAISRRAALSVRRRLSRPTNVTT